MEADWSRRSRLGQIVAVLMVLGTFLAYGGAAGGPVAMASEGHGLITGEVEPPKTVHQCQQKFKAGSSKLTACIKRVKHEQATAPGTSCTHPLEVNRSLEGGNGGTKYVKDELLAYKTGETVNQWKWEVTNSNVEICPHGITLEVIMRLPSGQEEFKHPSRLVRVPVSAKGHFEYPEEVGANDNLNIRARFIHPAHQASLARAHAASATTKTVAECKGRFTRGSTARTLCIKRVEAEKPGTSCAHPLFSGFAVDGAHSQKSDLKDFTVKFKLDSENKSESDQSITFQAEVSITNPRLVMCRLVVNEFKGSGRSWPLTIGPHGGLSSQLTLPVGVAFGIAGYARVE
jgi:hypothetical protein